MVASTGVVGGDPVQSLLKHVRALEAKLDALQQKHQSLHSHYQEECTSSLHDSMESLYKIVIHANKNDGKLIECHYRDGKVKDAFRFKRLDTLIERKTQKFKKEVQQVERKCDRANGVFDESVEAATHLKSEYFDFYVKSLEEVSKEAEQAAIAYKEHREQLGITIRENGAKRDYEAGEAENTEKSIMHVQKACNRAKNRQLTSNMVSFASFTTAGATAGGFVCTPILVPLVLGIGMAGYGYSYRGQIKDSQSQEEKFKGVRAEQLSSKQALENEGKVLMQGDEGYSDKLQCISKLQDRIRTMRSTSQAAVEQLRQTQMELDKISSKLGDIEGRLEVCQFMETRREVAKNLREVIQSIHKVGRSDKFSLNDEEKITKMMQAVAEFDERTEKVLGIAAAGARSGNAPRASRQ